MINWNDSLDIERQKSMIRYREFLFPKFSPVHQEVRKIKMSKSETTSGDSECSSVAPISSNPNNGPSTVNRVLTGSFGISVKYASSEEEETVDNNLQESPGIQSES